MVISPNSDRGDQTCKLRMVGGVGCVGFSRSSTVSLSPWNNLHQAAAAAPSKQSSTSSASNSIATSQSSSSPSGFKLRNIYRVCWAASIACGSGCSEPRLSRHPRLGNMQKKYPTGKDQRTLKFFTHPLVGPQAGITLPRRKERQRGRGRRYRGGRRRGRKGDEVFAADLSQKRSRCGSPAGPRRPAAPRAPGGVNSRPAVGKSKRREAPET